MKTQCPACRRIYAITKEDIGQPAECECGANFTMRQLANSQSQAPKPPPKQTTAPVASPAAAPASSPAAATTTAPRTEQVLWEYTSTSSAWIVYLIFLIGSATLFVASLAMFEEGILLLLVSAPAFFMFYALYYKARGDRKRSTKITSETITSSTPDETISIPLDTIKSVKIIGHGSKRPLHIFYGAILNIPDVPEAEKVVALLLATRRSSRQLNVD